ncbi:hypothetical protein B0H65DRAFT_545681 [Neurospora tetraspora]|uniref:tRNA pseudouridylate synthase B C-terminal domain-containing protein n=1 Tax=Neurospora tetraspora TaxID=94610 RepID=A0AAE0JIZ3_9PEZI|nr:hypothetical protein B0H65DRAFT_545681 [Neurospora tetraspora]
MTVTSVSSGFLARPVPISGPSASTLDSSSLGVGAHMQELRRVRSGIMSEDVPFPSAAEYTTALAMAFEAEVSHLE